MPGVYTASPDSSEIPTSTNQQLARKPKGACGYVATGFRDFQGGLARDKLRYRAPEEGNVEGCVTPGKIM